LVDAFVPHQAGGTGKQVSPEILKALHDQPLWLAGGLGVDNVADVIREWRPELVDASSKLEKEPGIKDHDKILRFVEEVRIAFP
jgi:phosphoribosylanthranilate isomerase